MISRKLEPLLINVKNSCSLECNSGLDQKIKSNLIADLLTLIGIRPLEMRKLQVNKISTLNTPKKNSQSKISLRILNSSNYKTPKKDAAAAPAQIKEERNAIFSTE